MKIDNDLINKYFGKNVRIIDTNGKTFEGKVNGCETPYDSDDGKWWIDVKVTNIPDFGCLTICEDEISKITEIN